MPKISFSNQDNTNAKDTNKSNRKRENITIKLKGIGNNRTINYLDTFDIKGGFSLSLENIQLSGKGVKVEEFGSLIMDNGAKITGNKENVGVYINNGNLTMNDGAVISDFEQGVVVNGGGKFVMNSGSITRNGNKRGIHYYRSSAPTGGGGVHVFSGLFIMNGGEITNNEYFGNGAGVEVHGGTKGKRPTFEMNGGVISENTAKTFTHQELHITIGGKGGGVHVFGGELMSLGNVQGTFKMTGGSIINNIGQSGRSFNNFVVDENAQNPGDVTISGGTIQKD
jgi:hypothetical protein